MVESRADNRIAFTVSIPLLLKALRAAAAHDATALLAKLTTRAGAHADPSHGGPPPLRPVLIFTWQGEHVALGQELPVGEPLRAGPDLTRIRALSEHAPLCPFYLDILPDLRRITACVDKLKALSDAARVSLLRHGDLHFSVDSLGVALGQGIPGFEVLWNREENDPEIPELQAERMDDRLREAAAVNAAAVDERAACLASALVEVDHLAKALHSAGMTMPERLLLGIRNAGESNLDGDGRGGGNGGGGGGGGSYVHFMFAWLHAQDEDGKFPLYIYFKCPIKEEE